jgi:iron complex outermembrane receptor protein
MRSTNHQHLFVALFVPIIWAVPVHQGISKTLEKEAIFDMSIHQLMQMEVEVTSASKRPQKLHETASAIYVVTQEDIRRTGAVNIMEALRIVPGVLVSKINQNRYVVSIRGFNRRFGSDKLLVLMDGRSIYSPFEAGVLWRAQDTVLEDIDRIEVIRGPGAALWGSNAVAGVINIITKNAVETQGVMVSAGGGTEENGFGTIRYGGKVGEKIFYRVYGKYRDRDEGKNVDGTDSLDGKIMGQGGFRSDLQVTPQDHLTVQGDYYNLESQVDINRFVSIAAGNSNFTEGEIRKGGNFLSRWTHIFDDDSELKFQFYYDRWERQATLPLNQIIDTIDFESQYDFSVGERQKISLGFKYRHVKFDFEETNTFRFVDSTINTTSNEVGIFVHDEITILPELWNLIIGSKFEHNKFSGFEIQPNIRTVWTPHPEHTIWGAISRAVRVPTVAEDRGFFDTRSFNFPPFPDPILLRTQGNGKTEAEELVAFELGYRRQFPARKLSFDVTAYLFEYDNLIESVFDSFFLESTPPGPQRNVNLTRQGNALKGETYGVELSAEWQATENLRLAGSYSFNKTDLRLIVPGAFIGFGDFEAEDDPEHIFSFRSYLQLPCDLEFDSMLYVVSKNKARDVASYTRLDFRLGWQPIEEVEISLVGQNLLDDQHSELNEASEANSETQRSFYVKGTFRF